jgi:hypothetical protein
MGWLDALIQAAKAIWYLFLRKSQFVKNAFFGTGQLPTVSRGSAQASHGPRRRLVEDLRAAEDPVLRVLRQRAAVELFEWLGIDQIPASYWTLRDRVRDPSTALMEFISNGRFDPALVRKRAATELAAFQNHVRFVCQVEESIDLVPERQRTLLDQHAHYGEHEIVRSLLELFVTLNEAVKFFEQSPEPYRFAAFVLHTRKVVALRESAAPEALDEAKALLEASRHYSRLTLRFRNAVDRKERIEAAAGKQWKSLSGHDRPVWTGLMSDLAQARSALLGNSDTSVEDEVKYFEQCVEGLAALLDEVTNRARHEAAGRERRRRENRARRQEEEQQRTNEKRSGPDLEGREAKGLSRDELLSIFDFPPDTSPGLSALRRAFIREANKTNPVFGQSDYRERNDRYRVLKDAYERLKVDFG